MLSCGRRRSFIKISFATLAVALAPCAVQACVGEDSPVGSTSGAPGGLDSLRASGGNGIQRGGRGGAAGGLGGEIGGSGANGSSAGGGGAVGRIRLNTRDQPLISNFVISPSLTEMPTTATRGLATVQ